jgi:ParB/RepB/Spo0J family partition protein
MIRKNERRSIELGELVPHPLQAAYFEDLSQFDLEALADDIRRNGLRCPIEVLPRNRAGLPENTIIAGHQRRRALEKLGETEATVIVRHDLADADETTIEQCLLQDNQNRRHLDQFAKARVALRLFEIERREGSARTHNGEESDARDRVGKAIGMSGRNLQRYFRVLQMPREIQEAVRSKRLPLTLAQKVADLAPESQEHVAKRIGAGKDPIAVVRKLLPKREERHDADGALAILVRGLERSLDELDERTEAVSIPQLTEHLVVLKKGRSLLRRLIKRAEPEEPPVE